jgi:hypothetical protein
MKLAVTATPKAFRVMIRSIKQAYDVTKIKKKFQSQNSSQQSK